MTTYVALLRGVNVAGHGKVTMGDLRRVFEGLGYADVSTYIQSGNVIFSGTASVDAVERAIATELGMEVVVVLRTAAQLEKVVRRNPFADVDVSKVHVGFMPKRPSATAVKTLDIERFRPEDAIVVGSDVYVHLPNGMGRSKLPDYVGRQLDVPITFRNWNTVTKLVELAAA